MEIRRLQTPMEAEQCARIMAASDPWKRLNRNYQQCLCAISDHNRETYLGVSGDTVLGFIIINMHGAFIGYIQTVCISADLRSQGIGSQLISFGEERIFRDTPNVFMCVSSFNERARQLYEKLGYERIGELKDFIVPGHAEILLRKTIGPLADFKNHKG